MPATARRLSPFAWLVLGVVVLVALLPWWRNHAYLRDLYDYGIVLNANGHLDRGERPYVDFTTPIQAGFLGINWLIQRAGGGTYAALTLGGAGLIVATALLLPLMLVRRWPWWAAVTVGGAVAIAAASQHTILWHNSLGVFCLALAAWGAACAPVLRRVTWPWHVLAAAGLFLGGLNKLNFQLVAVAVSLAWAVRAGLGRQAGQGRVLATAAAILLAGLVLPVATELLWTGASLKLWLANVVQLAAGSRTAILAQIGSPKFLFHPIHDYYGRQPLPQAGLVGLVVTLATLAGCWPVKPRAGEPRWDRGLAPLAALGAGAAAAALLATNFEIASLGLGAWLVLASSVWLGFAPAGRRALFVGGLILPALLVAATAWWSAWLGQRSQFGYSNAPRADYRPADKIAPAFADLAGLRLPPDVMASLEIVEQTMPDAAPDGYRAVFYGSGMEWLDRYFPGPREKGKPLWVHWDTTYGPRLVAQLRKQLADEDRYRTLFTTIARDEWPADIRAVLDRDFLIDLASGPTVRRWTRRDRDAVDFSDSLDTVARLGGNTDGRILHFENYPLRARRTPDDRLLLATSRPTGEVLLGAAIYRMKGLAVVTRLPGAGDGLLAVDLKVIVHGASPEDVRWAQHVELPPGRQEVTVPFTVDGGGRRLMLWVTRPDGQTGGLLAGYRELEITQAGEAEGGAPRLRNEVAAETATTPELAASLFGAIAWRPQQLVVRGGRAGADGLELPAGAEVWLHTAGMTGEIRGQLMCPAAAGARPSVRVLWYKGGRLQILQQGAVPAGAPFDFHVWTAEPGGWIGLVVEPGKDTAPAVARISRSTLVP